MHHQVRHGDNLSKIARRYGVTVIYIIRLNPHLKKRRHRINVGERIKIR
ncbi:LysM peptidoglycan-binding domain-containing protein [Dehalobacter sp. DCM]|nr:LysM peptidoglycan-binding domain-containing protein [Dehalobacter sp. DCM]